jgi:hypothetical protein
MQALRRLAVQALQLQPLGARAMSITGPASTPAAIKGAKHSSGRADLIGCMLAAPACIGIVAYDLVYPEEEFEGQIPAYPYMRMRTREEFPWGERGMLEYHRYVGTDELSHSHH